MIKYVDLGVTPKEYEENISPLLKDIFLSGQFVYDQQVKEFENSFANYCATKYAVALNSGTDALIFALKSLDIGVGDEVITVSNSFIATANAIVEVGATPVFVDINNDLLINSALIESAITKQTKAIMPVHLMGSVCNMDEIIDIANKHSLEIIEDAAQSVGSTYKGKKTGTFGKVGCFSLHPLKNLSGITDGGIVVTNDMKIASFIRESRNHGLIDRDRQNIIGRVSRLSAINAVVLSYRLQHLELLLKSRRTSAKEYDFVLQGISGVSILPRSMDVVHTYHTYIIEVEHRDSLVAYLFDNGIETKVHYPILIHHQKEFQKYNMSLNNTERLASKILTLPIRNIKNKEIQYIGITIANFYKEKQW